LEAWSEWWSGMPCAYFKGKNREMKVKKEREGLLFRRIRLRVCGVSKNASRGKNRKTFIYPYA